MIEDTDNLSKTIELLISFDIILPKEFANTILE